MTTFTLRLTLKDATLSDAPNEINHAAHQKWIKIRNKLTEHYGFKITAKDMYDEALVQKAQQDMRINVNALLTLIVMERCLNNTDEAKSALVLQRNRHDDSLRVTVVIETDISAINIQRILNAISEMVIDGETDRFIISGDILKITFDTDAHMFKPEATISCERLLDIFESYIANDVEAIESHEIAYQNLKNIGLTDKEIRMFGYDYLIPDKNNEVNNNG